MLLIFSRNSAHLLFISACENLERGREKKPFILSFFHSNNNNNEGAHIEINKLLFELYSSSSLARSSQLERAKISIKLKNMKKKI